MEALKCPSIRFKALFSRLFSVDDPFGLQDLCHMFKTGVIL